MRLNFMNLNIFIFYSNNPVEVFRKKKEEENSIRKAFKGREDLMRQFASMQIVHIGPVSNEEIDYIEKQINTTGLDFEIKEDYNPKLYEGYKNLNEDKLRAMANDGDSHAKYYLSLLLERQGKAKEAQELLIDSAINECPLAQCELGNKYYDNNGLYYQERSISGFWTFMAAKNGYLWALRIFTLRLAGGNYDVHVSEKLLIDLWLNMADRNDKDAQFTLVSGLLKSEDKNKVEEGLKLADKYIASGNREVESLIFNYKRSNK